MDTACPFVLTRLWDNIQTLVDCDPMVSLCAVLTSLVFILCFVHQFHHDVEVLLCERHNLQWTHQCDRKRYLATGAVSGTHKGAPGARQQSV